MFDTFPDSAHIWIFPAAEPLNQQQEQAIQSSLSAFIGSWAAHGEPLSAAAEVAHKRFVLVCADEEQVRASGCSIDALQRAVTAAFAAAGAELSDNSRVFWHRDSAVVSADRTGFRRLVEQGEISGDTPVFDNSITRLGELRSGGWERSYNSAWHSRAFGSLPL